MDDQDASVLQVRPRPPANRRQRAWITCIYCRKVAPPGNEHVILDGLGGTTTIPDVCRSCNKSFGETIDAQLLHESPMALHRLFDPRFRSSKVYFVDHPALGGHFDEVDGAMLLQVWNPSAWQMASADENALPKLAAWLANVPDEIPRRTRPGKESIPTRLVFRKAGLIRAATKDEADEFEALLRRDAQKLVDLTTRQKAPYEPSVNVRAHVTMSSEPNHMSRCAAKMVLNFVAHYLGPEFALDPRLDVIREYIRTEAPVVSATDENGEVGIRMDLRFVNHWLKEIEEQILPTNTQAVELNHDPRVGLVARVTIFGTPTFKVRLGAPDLVPPADKQLPAALVVEGSEERLLMGDAVSDFFAARLSKP